ncbi:class D sortase [Cohnella boryungensis]|uniref:Class D sortase n=1 Tax=Cohnella boryungensis TaxID=768479 RepID=A0ABV8S588_9BACL
MKFKIFAYVLIVAGVILLAFPSVREYIYDREQQQLLDSLEQSPERAAKQTKIRSEYDRLSAVFDGSAAGQAAVANVPANAEEEETVDEGAIAIIQIDKIDLKLPVLEGATMQNMKVGAGHLKETAAIGEVGNSAIAAHRARTTGRLFNRLNEMEIGDRIDIRLKDGKAAYTVTEIKVVEPTDLSVLESDGKDAMLTLITCEPLVNPTHRLIVHAVKTEE